MSDSSDKLTGFSRRQSTNRRQRPRQVPKQGQKKVKVPAPQPRSRVKKSAAPPSPSMPHGVARGQPLIVTPTFKGKKPTAKATTVKYKTVPVKKQVMPKRVSRVRKTRLKPMARTLLYSLRLLIVGVGIGALVGTVLSVLDPATRITPAGRQSNTTVAQVQQQTTPNPTAASSLNLSQEIVSLKTAVQNLASNNPNLTPGVFFVDLDNGNYVDVNAASTFPSASIIKLPILIAFFQDVDAGKIRLDEMLIIEKEMIASGSGEWQNKPVGSKFTALETATKMITISDNTATNMLIAKLGGIEALNQRFRSWGLTNTVIRNQLPDLQGTNTTTPKELGNLMATVNQGNLVSVRSRDRMLDIMRRTVRDNLLPSGLAAGTTVAHKTGDIGTMLGDAGLVDLPSGKRYIAAVMVQRSNNDARAEKLISSISRAAYQQFSQNSGTSSGTPSGTPSDTPNNTTGNQQTPASPTPTPSPTSSPPPPSNPVNTMPMRSYQPPVMSPVPPSSTTTNIPPMSSYQYPPMNPYPNSATGNMPPMTNYSQYPPSMSPPGSMGSTSPGMNPAYYNPYQR